MFEWIFAKSLDKNKSLILDKYFINTIIKIIIIFKKS